MIEIHLTNYRTFNQASDVQDRITGCVFSNTRKDGSCIQKQSDGTYTVIIYTNDLVGLVQDLVDEGFSL